jgi:hypothetical protein
MTDPSDDQRDELASAYLDGEATAAERARVEADPDLVRRVAELGVVRAALGAPGPSARAETRDRAITAALAASPPAAKITPLHRGRSSRRPLAILGAAAAAVAVIAAVAVVATRSSNNGTSTSARASTTARAAGSTATFGPETQSAGTATSAAATGGVSSTTGATSAAGRDTSSAAAGTSAPRYLGVADDDSELRALLGGNSASAVSAPLVPAPPPAPAASSCTVPGATLVGTVTWQGAAAFVFVANGLATVIQVSDCRPVATVPLT